MAPPMARPRASPRPTPSGGTQKLRNHQVTCMSLLDWLGTRALLQWFRYRNVDHFEIRCRPPKGRGWRRVDDPDEVFDPSDLDEPIAVTHFLSHAEAMGYYQGEYRLVPIDTAGRMGSSVWQTWFYDGPSLAVERWEEERERARRQELMEVLDATLDELERQLIDD